MGKNPEKCTVNTKLKPQGRVSVTSWKGCVNPGAAAKNYFLNPVIFLWKVSIFWETKCRLLLKYEQHEGFDLLILWIKIINKCKCTVSIVWTVRLNRGWSCQKPDHTRWVAVRKRHDKLWFVWNIIYLVHVKVRYCCYCKGKCIIYLVHVKGYIIVVTVKANV